MGCIFAPIVERNPLRDRTLERTRTNADPCHPCHTAPAFAAGAQFRITDSIRPSGYPIEIHPAKVTNRCNRDRAPVDPRPEAYVRRLPQKLHRSRVEAGGVELTSRESPGTGKRRPVTELLLDAQELVVLRESFRLGERADLDLARGGGDGEVCEEGILRLS